jgi:glycosyltransferase involved in cell wall biosynthesis
MRVWIINHYAIPPSMGGLVRHYYFSRYLRKMGHDVRILTASEIHNTDINMIRDGSLYREEMMDGVPYTFLKTRDYSGNGLSRIYNMLEFPIRIQQIVKKLVKNGERPDVIYTSAPTIFAAGSALIAARRLKVPCVVEVRDIWPESIVEYKGMSRKNPIIAVLYQLEKWLYRGADRLIFTMEGGSDYIKEKGWEEKIPLEKIRNLNNGVDLEEFDRNREEYQLEDADLLDEHTFKVVYTGSIRLVNNLGKVVEMAEYMKQHGEDRIRFLLYGDGTEREELMEQCRQKGLDNIRFPGKVEKKYIPFILSKSDLNLNHVKQTGIMRFGCSLNKQFDYFASGKPVLSDLTVSHDLIERYGAGVTLPTQDTEALCQEVLRFANMPKEEYEQYCVNARHAAEQYDYQELTQKLLEILQETQK